jgi:hypothetical protein
VRHSLLHSTVGPPVRGLLALPGSLLGRAWPGERVVLGMRVCKALREELLCGVERIVLQRKRYAEDLRVDTAEFTRDLTRFRHRNQAVLLRMARGREGLKTMLTTSLLCGMTIAIPEMMHTALASVDMVRNRIGDEGAAQLAAVLGRCSALTHLDLGQNEIGDEGAGRLARMIKGCSALLHLDLSKNQLRAYCFVARVCCAGLWFSIRCAGLWVSVSRSLRSSQHVRLSFLSCDHLPCVFLSDARGENHERSSFLSS